ncbi:MAG: type VI secretion system ATPase TssH, partial [Solobacterium sp.]|nr:type VI secretion system ATPase TssH [Solobacterium sp.]
MNIEQMTEQLQEILMRAVSMAREKLNSEIAAEHILSAMCENDSLDGIWQRLNIDKDDLSALTEDAVNRLPSVSGSSEPTVSRDLSQGYTNALQYMKQKGDTYMSTAA